MIFGPRNISTPPVENAEHEQGFEADVSGGGAGYVTEFEEKPSRERLVNLEGVSKNATAEDQFEASMGIYMFKREVLERLLGQNENHFGDQAGADTHFGYDVIPHALRDGYRIVAHHHPGYWRVRLFCLKQILTDSQLEPDIAAFLTQQFSVDPQWVIKCSNVVA